MDQADRRSAPREAADAQEVDRAYGALLGLAIGDALGMPTQGFSRTEVARRWTQNGGIIDGFNAAPADNPISAGLPAGRVTDDTDQAVIVARLLIAGDGRIDPHAFASALMSWQERMRAAGSQDLLGSSTNRALAALAAGVSVEESGGEGTTNGAAMRIAPLGIATKPQPLDVLVDAVADASRLTHNTGEAIAGAAAIAGAVSAGVSGWPLKSAIGHAIEAARIGQRRGHKFDGPDLSDAVSTAVSVGQAHRGDYRRTHLRLLDTVTTTIGTGLSTHESVPAAFSLLAATDDPWTACRLAASLGGDSDTIAAMAGAMSGAVHGASAFPPVAVAAMLDANPELRLAVLSQDLLTLRTDRTPR